MAGPGWAQFGSAAVELDLIKVRDDVYVIHNEAVPGNVTALVTDEGVLLVDNKFPIDFENMISLLRTVTDQPIKYAVDTHYHDDHSGSNALLQAGDTKVFAAATARAKMVEAGRAEGLPDVTLDGHVRIYLGGKPVDLYYFGRAHTDGDVVVHFPEHGIVAMGDMFTHGEGLPQLVDYAGGGSARAWTSAVDGVLRLDFDTVIPGHGSVATRADLESFRASTARLQEMTHALLQHGRSRDEVAQMLRNEFGFQDFHIQMSLDGLLVELR
jgi:glyoxylase-like metal-dependent hydrolase (beta-lactamase superfamily II)